MTRIRTLLLSLAALLVVGTAGPVAAESDDDVDRKVVFHVDYADPDRFNLTLINVRNMVKHYKDELLDYDVRIVFISQAVRYVTDEEMADTPFETPEAFESRRAEFRDRLQTLADVHDVKLELCNITRTIGELEEDDLYANVDVVPSGVVRVAELQRKGYQYIKVQ
ncbi:MAG: DsrE family protein [Pseudomonadota bacterium]